MNVTSKNILLVSTVALLIVTPTLFLMGFLHAGLPAAMACYGLVLASLAVVWHTSNARKKGETVLDYGCGVGNYSIEAARIVGESGTVVVADISAEMLQRLEKRVGNSVLSNISPVLINSTEDIEGSNFDFILLIDVLHLIKDKVATVDFLLGKLCGNGRLLVTFDHF